MASDRPEAEEERREVEDVIEEVEESEEGLGSPELMIKHPLQVGHGQQSDMKLHRCKSLVLSSNSCLFPLITD